MANGIFSSRSLEATSARLSERAHIQPYKYLFSHFLKNPFIVFDIFPIFREREGISREKHETRVLEVDSSRDL